MLWVRTQRSNRPVTPKTRERTKPSASQKTTTAPRASRGSADGEHATTECSHVPPGRADRMLPHMAPLPSRPPLVNLWGLRLAGGLPAVAQVQVHPPPCHCTSSTSRSQYPLAASRDHRPPRAAMGRYDPVRQPPDDSGESSRVCLTEEGASVRCSDWRWGRAGGGTDWMAARVELGVDTERALPRLLERFARREPAGADLLR